MSVNLKFTDEERSFFIVRSLDTLFKLGQAGKVNKGVFDSKEGVLQYEKVWHSKIYERSKQGLSDVVC